MKQRTSKLSVGIVGFLAHRTPPTGENAYGSSSANVGLAKNPQKPDSKPDNKPDISVAATPSTPQAVVGPRVINAMRRDRESALEEDLDVTAAEPEWSCNSKLVPDSRIIRIPSMVRVKIEAIEAEARAKGWPVELLYNADFWALPRGLAAVLDEDDEIGEITHDYIEILRCQRDVLRFQRRNS